VQVKSLHETTTASEKGEMDEHKGLWPVVEEFLKKGPFWLRDQHEENIGLAVVEWVGDHRLTHHRHV
jgi:hypothetical protein